MSQPFISGNYICFPISQTQAPQASRPTQICYNNIYPPVIVVYDPHEGEVLTTLAFTFNILTASVYIPPDLLNPDVKKIDIAKPFTPQTGTILANAIARLTVLSYHSEIPRISINARAVNTIFPPICETSYVMMRQTTTRTFSTTRQTRTKSKEKGVNIFSESSEGVQGSSESTSTTGRVKSETAKYTPIAVAGTMSALSRIISTTITRGIGTESLKEKLTKIGQERSVQFEYSIKQTYVRFFTSREEVENYVTTTVSSLTNA